MRGYTMQCPECIWLRYGTTTSELGRAYDRHARTKHGRTRTIRPQPHPQQGNLLDPDPRETTDASNR